MKETYNACFCMLYIMAMVILFTCPPNVEAACERINVDSNGRVVSPSHCTGINRGDIDFDGPGVYILERGIRYRKSSSSTTTTNGTEEDDPSTTEGDEPPADSPVVADPVWRLVAVDTVVVAGEQAKFKIVSSNRPLTGRAETRIVIEVRQISLPPAPNRIVRLYDRAIAIPDGDVDTLFSVPTYKFADTLPRTWVRVSFRSVLYGNSFALVQVVHPDRQVVEPPAQPVPDPEPPETGPRYLPEDFNMDGEVDVEDFNIFYDALSATPSDGHWVEACDLDGNGEINVEDFLILVSAYGKTPE